MNLTKLSVFVAAIGILLVAACGDDDDDVGPTATGTSVTPPSSAMGPGISVSEALASTLDQPLLVNGFLVVKGDEALLCEALAESFPAQCGGPSLTVEGLDVGEIAGLSSEQDVTWSDQSIQLLGTVEDGMLTVDSLSSG